MAKTFQYIVVHRGLKGRPGVLAAQVAHAAAEAIRDAPISSRTHVCVLEAGSSAELQTLSIMLREASVHHALICEPDPPYNGAATALGVEPQDKALVEQYFVGYPLLK